MRGTAIGAGLILVACGGSAVVDPATTSGTGGTAGSGGTTTGTGSTTTTTTSSGGAGGAPVTCEQLEQLLWERLMTALECNPALSVEQCTGQEMVYDDCGCEMAANALHPDAAQAARDAFDGWVDAGCGPYLCTWCVEPLPAYCEPGSGSGSGLCVSAVN